MDVKCFDSAMSNESFSLVVKALLSKGLSSNLGGFVIVKSGEEREKNFLSNSRGSKTLISSLTLDRGIGVDRSPALNFPGSAILKLA